MLGSRVLDLIEVMDRLRSPGGCPWDSEQTHESLVEHLVEETYETIDAIDSGDMVALREELGDLLLQVVFHARIGQEDSRAPWNIDDVAGGITDKLLARHPHVFAAGHAESAADVEAQWQARKAAEKGRTSVTDGVPIGMPPIVQAHKLLRRAARGGVPTDGATAPGRELAQRVFEELPTHDPQARELALGEVLVALVALASDHELDVDQAMRTAVSTLRARIQQQEESVR